MLSDDFGCQNGESTLAVIFCYYFFRVHIHSQKRPLLSAKVGNRVAGGQAADLLICLNIEAHSLLHIMHGDSHNLSRNSHKHKVNLHSIIDTLYCCESSVEIGDIALEWERVFVHYLVLSEDDVLGQQCDAHVHCFLLLGVYDFDCF